MKFAKFNRFNNIGAQMLDSIYHMTLKGPRTVSYSICPNFVARMGIIDNYIYA